MIIVLDGFGIGKSDDSNAIHLANTPTFDKLFKEHPMTELEASGLLVGLPEGQMGNSEVGHLNIGAGRVVYQTLTEIGNSIQNGSINDNEVLKESITKAKDGSFHIIGLLSPGGVHSHEDHILAVLKKAKAEGATDVKLHLILDGRDTPPTSGLKSVDLLEYRMAHVRLGTIATVTGRYYGMDRDQNWDRTKRAYDAIMCGEGNNIINVKEYIKDSYEDGITDEFILPSVVGDYDGIKEEDSVLFINFRPDRARQLTEAMTSDTFESFERCGHTNVPFASMAEYDINFKNVDVVFKDEAPENTIGEFISDKGLKQLRIAETEKYAHVTFFLNGGLEKEFEGEDRILIPSPKVATFDLEPEMSASLITEEVVKAIEENKYDFIMLNYANLDMVGHTGDFNATIKAIETVDHELGKLLKSLDENNGKAIITSDHGNAELMKTEQGDPITSHTTNKVPMIIYGDNLDIELKSGGALQNIAPTLLDLMGLDKPEEMTAESLIERR